MPDEPLGTTSSQTGLSIAIATAETLSKTAQLIRKLSAAPQGTFGGLPIGIYRADLLPNEHLLTNPETHELQEPHPSELEVAYVELSFQEGFPTLPSGSPFWFKMDFEPAPAFSAFQLYLEQIESGPRSLHHIATTPELKTLYNGQTYRLVQEWFVTYYWKDRAKAHDIYKEAAYRHLRARRAIHTEDRHFEVADKLLQLASTYLGSERFLQEMTPRTALEALKLATSLQRVSVGLPSNGPLSSKEENAQTPGNWELVVRQVSQRNNTETFDQEGNLITDASLALNSLLDDPNHASVMQEVIIRMSAASKGNKNIPFADAVNVASPPTAARNHPAAQGGPENDDDDDDDLEIVGVDVDISNVVIPAPKTVR